MLNDENSYRASMIDKNITSPSSHTQYKKVDLLFYYDE